MKYSSIALQGQLKACHVSTGSLKYGVFVPSKDPVLAYENTRSKFNQAGNSMYDNCALQRQLCSTCAIWKIYLMLPYTFIVVLLKQLNKICICSAVQSKLYKVS